MGFVRNADVVLCAVSHSARFEKRSNLTRATEAAMDETLEQESVIQWPASPGAQPRVTRSHAALARQTDAKVVCSVPLAHGPRFCGVVTLERGEPKPFSESEIELLEAAVALAGPTLDVQRRDDRLLVAKVWESTRASLGESLGPRNLALKLGGIAALFLLLFLALGKGDYRVSADAVLEAEVLRAAVAPFDGYVVEAPLRAGDPVAEGTLLAALDDREFALERARYASQLQQLEKQHRQAMAKREASQIRILSAQIDQVNAQLGLVEEQLAHMRIVAPFDGRIVTGDLSQQLGAPVARGDVLFEVAPLDGFRVALEVDERDIDEIRVGQGGDLVFSASPQDALRFKVEKITPVSAASEGSNTFRVEARLEAPPARLQPGMEGVAKVEVDRRRLLWIWTHEITDWIRLSLWKWTP